MRSKRPRTSRSSCKPDIDAVGEARLRDAPPGRLELGLRQRDAGDTGAGDARQIERQTAEAAADVEHVLPGLDDQLGGDVALLGQLRAFERLPGVIEIGAGMCRSESRNRANDHSSRS